jgi:DNA-binding NarL/FixJ family response regulator
MPPETFVAIVGRDRSRRRPGELALMPRVGYNNSVIRVVICDDHPIVREGLRLVVNSSPDIRVADEVSSGPELLEKIRRTRFDVVILDISFPEGLEGLEVLNALRREPGCPPVLVLSMHAEDEYAIRALRRGAAGYLAKDVEAGELMAAIRTVASGSAYVSCSLAELLAKDPDDARVRAPHEDLTDRELSILRLLARGNGPSEVARKLCLSPSTVETCRSRILARLGLKSTAELVRYVIDHGLTD